MRAQSAYQRVVDNTRMEYNGGPEMPANDRYEDDDCRYGHVMRMIRAGKSDLQIVDRYPEFANYIDALAVYRKIANGTIRRGKVIRGKTTRTRTAVGLFAEVIAGEMNGESVDIIAERLGIDRRRVEYYTRGVNTQSKRRKKREQGRGDHLRTD